MFWISGFGFYFRFLSSRIVRCKRYAVALSFSDVPTSATFCYLSLCHMSDPPTHNRYPLLLVSGSLFTLIDSKRAKPFGKYDAPKPGWDSTSDLTFRRIGIPLWVGALIFLCWGGILGGCLLYRASDGFETGGALALFECMFRTGSIIFGGGQVVLPMLYSEVVDTGWISSNVSE